MLTALILTAATAQPVEWELRIGATSTTGQASSSGRFPTRERCENAGKVMVAFLEGGEATKGMGVRVKAVCVSVPAHR
ncbi:MAG TPA: hypothetical protein VEC57_20925 [Candidatus Limnocylindrales bacterium]|nr:hypothetical protein [Candidatus Limnocylindrales bacterium]